MKELKIKIVVLLIISILCTSCNMITTQSKIDKILPGYSERMYTLADLIPYSYQEIKNARSRYGIELLKFFNENTATESELKRDTEEKKMKFYRELLFRYHNYAILNQRYSMYLSSDGKTIDKTLCDGEYNDYYAMRNAKSINIIKKYNDGRANGMPLMSIRIDMSTATMSDTDSIFSEAMCEIYKPTIIKNEDYDKLKIGDKIILEVPTTPSTIDCTLTKKLECTYIATDSLVYKDENDNDKYYFIANVDGTNDCRRILNIDGKVIETFSEMKPLQFMRLCRVTEANDDFRLMKSVVDKNIEEYKFNEFVNRAMCGGYVTYKYKDYVYANSITTNLKGYITALTEYSNQCIDNKFRETIQ